MERIIDVYYDRLGYPFKDRELTARFPVVGSEFLGASQTTTIRFHYEQLGTDENVYTVESKRPDGKTGSQLLSKNTTEHYAEMSLSGWYSECKGDLFLSLKVYRGGTTATYNETTQLWEVNGVPVIESTGAIKLAINYTPMGRYENYEDAVETFQQVLAALGDKLDTIKGIVGVSGLTQVDTTEYEEGQLFFDVDTKNIYKLESGEFVKINNKLEIIDVSGYEYEELFAMFGTQPFMSYFEETTNLAVYQFKQNGNDYSLYVWAHNNGCLYIPYVDMSAIFSIDDFTNLEYEKAPVITLSSDMGTLSDLDYQKVLQPNASIKLEDLYYVKAYEDDNLIEFRHYEVAGYNYSSYVGYHIIAISKVGKSYRTTSNIESFYDTTKIDQLLSQKQDRLVSGRNIKTINNISLLGSGNIDIQGGSGSSEWGSIGGDIADQTDLQNEFQDIREVAEGKCKTWILSYRDTSIGSNYFQYSYYNPSNGEIKNFTDSLTFNLWKSGANVVNSSFNSQNSNLGVSINSGDVLIFRTQDGRYLLIKTKEATMEGSIYYPYKLFHAGDVFLVLETDVPDRWYESTASSGMSFYKLETSKVDLTNYSTKTQTSTEVNKVAHDIAVEYDENTLYGSGDLCIKDKLLYKCNTDNTTGTWDGTKWDLTTVNSELGIIKATKANTADVVDLTSAQTVSGQKTFTSAINVVGLRDATGSAMMNFGDYFVTSARTIRPISDNTQSLGTSSFAWANLLLKGNISDGTNSVNVADLANLIAYAKSQGWIS